MTALTTDRNTSHSEGDQLSILVAAAETIYAGSLVCLDADGYAVAAADTSGYIFAGVAMKQADNSGGAAGAVSVIVHRRCRFRLASSTALTQAAVGGLVYVDDDQTVQQAYDATNDVPVGMVTRVLEAYVCEVDIDAVVRAGRAWTGPTTTTTAAPTTTTTGG